MKRITLAILLLTGVSAMSLDAAIPEWVDFNNVERTDDGFRTTGPDPFIVSAPFEQSVGSERSILLLETSASEACGIHAYWWRSDQVTHFTRLVDFAIAKSDTPTVQVIDIGTKGTFDGADHIRIGLRTNQPGVEFKIHRLEFITAKDIPESFQSKMVDFRAFTSKLHYQPGEAIEYKATMQARNYPDRESSKILDVVITDAAGKEVAHDTQHYGFHPLQQIKELYGSFHAPEMTPGKYLLKVTSTDQRSGLTLESVHDFGIQGDDDPFLCETPFKFVKDFTIICDDSGLWHIFSITGELMLGHDWLPDGNERTFSHSTSPDLRNWTQHKPVLSISDDLYPDGNGPYQNRNIWAPHVIKHDGLYYMFYTSINEHVSQSVSLATSKDLFEWTEYADNPVSTPEDADWAHWGRSQWGDYRDPVVFADKDADGTDRFYMYVTAHANSGELRGAVSVAESTDLIHWTTPKIAVRGNVVSESPQVWKKDGTYFMSTSSTGSDTYTSKHPVDGWAKTPFAKPHTPDFERLVNTSGLYGEEVVELEDGSHLLAMMTFRHWGNSLYIFRIKTDERGYPIGHESPFEIPCVSK